MTLNLQQQYYEDFTNLVILMKSPNFAQMLQSSFKGTYDKIKTSFFLLRNFAKLESDEDSEKPTLILFKLLVQNLIKIIINPLKEECIIDGKKILSKTENYILTKWWVTYLFMLCES